MALEWTRVDPAGGRQKVSTPCFAAVDVALHIPYLLVGSVEAGTYQQLSGFNEKIS